MNPIKFADQRISWRFMQVKRNYNLLIDDTKDIRARFGRLITLYSSALMFQSQVGLHVIKTLNTDQSLIEITSNDKNAVDFLTLTLQ
jgi:hypothetical protein